MQSQVIATALCHRWTESCASVPLWLLEKAELGVLLKLSIYSDASLKFSVKTWVIPGKNLIVSMLAKARVLTLLLKKGFARELISQPITGPAGCSSRALGLGSNSGFRGSAFSSAHTAVRVPGLQPTSFQQPK